MMKKKRQLKNQTSMPVCLISSFQEPLLEYSIARFLAGPSPQKQSFDIYEPTLIFFSTPNLNRVNLENRKSSEYETQVHINVFARLNQNY